MTELQEQCYSAIHLLRAWHSPSDVAEQLQRHPNWVRKYIIPNTRKNAPAVGGSVSAKCCS